MFYLTLPSNSSFAYFPDNTLTNYKTQLPQVINLSEGEWEVGLVEIQYPRTWYNVHKGDVWLRLSLYAEDNRVDMPAGYYDNPAKFIRILKEIMVIELGKKHENFFRIRYDDASKKVSLDVNKGVTITLSESMKSMLGMDQRCLGEGFHDAPFIIDVNQGFYSLYVYCDLVQPRVVGDSLVPLLRIVPVSGKTGQTLTKTYENIHYHLVQQKHFSTVEIDIKDDTDRLVPFESGKVIVTLHFRRRRSRHFM